MNLVIFLFIAFAISVFSVVRNLKSDKTCGRKVFISALLFAGAPVFILIACDISALVFGEIIAYTDILLQITYVYLAIVAYPFYQRVCWRVNDAGAGKLIAYFSLVPYLNFFSFLYLSIVPTKSSN